MAERDTQPRGLKCPSCSVLIKWQQISSSPFPCPACGQRICFGPSYLLSKGVADLIITVAVVYIMGARSPVTFVLGAAIAYFPVSMAAWIVFRRLFPPALKFCSDYGVRCPVCSARIPWKKVSVSSPFRCSACGASVCVARVYLISKGVVEILLIGTLAYFLGARSAIALVAVTAVALFPVSVLGWIILRSMLPPNLTLSGDYRNTLYDRDGHEP